MPLSNSHARRTVARATASAGGRSAQRRHGIATTGTLAARTLHRLIEFSTAEGIPRGFLLSAANLTEEDLADADARVPMSCEIAIWRVLARRVPEPGFGVRCGATFSIGPEAGLFGYLLRFSATLRNALHRAERYSRILSDAVRLMSKKSEANAVYAVSHGGLADGLAFAEDTKLAGIVRISRELTGVDITPVEVRFTHQQPPSILAHREFFRCPLRFESQESAVAFRERDLDLPLATADEQLAGYLTKYAERVLASLAQGETTRHKVRAGIWSALGDGHPTLKRVAAFMRVPPRTLQRHLKDEGTSLHHEVQEIRKTMAAALLRDRSIAIDEVASLLGYSEPSTFYRSFRRWTGKTPRQFRRAAA